MSYSRTVIPRIAERLAPLVEQAAEVVREEIVGVMRVGSPSGFTDAEQYQSSAPGEPPAYGRGVYARSWKASTARVEGRAVVAEAYSSMVDPRTGRLVADALEHGDDAAPRPHVRPGLYNALPELRRLVKRAGRG